MLLNVGPKGDGSLRLIDKGMLELIGGWVKLNDEALRNPAPTNIEIQDKPDDFILNEGNNYYLFVHNLSMTADLNVALNATLNLEEKFFFDKAIKSVEYLDNGESLEFTQDNNNVIIHTKPFSYGESYVIRVVKFTV